MSLMVILEENKKAKQIFASPEVVAALGIEPRSKV
jgi:hypothetical protein